MNDEDLRRILHRVGRHHSGEPREDEFYITAASGGHGGLSLAEELRNLKERLGRMVVAVTFFGKPVPAAQLEAKVG